MKFEIENDLEKIVRVGKTLAYPMRIRILQVLHNNELTLNEIHEKIPEIKYKDNIYRHLEKLKKIGLVHKHYNNKKNKLVYELKEKKLVLIF